MRCSGEAGWLALGVWVLWHGLSGCVAAPGAPETLQPTSGTLPGSTASAAAPAPEPNTAAQLRTAADAFTAADAILAPDPITAADIQAHVDVLASDAFEGRGTATHGERLAGDYIVSVLEALPRLQPAGDAEGWFQEFPVTIQLPGAVFDHPRARNVLALLPGSDPALADEFVVLGAHYDHVGKQGLHGGSLHGQGQIHNGADDNASGSALLLELAATLATSPEPPRRSVLLQWYSGEELGLLGSKWWVANAQQQLDDIAVMLNFDMVGRLFGSTLMVGGTASSPVLDELVAELEGFEGLAFLLDPPGSAPSDNASFYEHEIPVLFLFTGVHADYHASTDDPEKLNAEGTARVARLAEALLRRLDAAEDPPPFTPAPGMANYWVPQVFYGLTLGDPPEDGPGVASIAVLIPNSPAGRTVDAAGRGLSEGDLVVAVDGRVLASRDELEQFLRQVDDARTPHRVRVLRPLTDDDWETIEVSVRPEVK